MILVGVAVLLIMGIVASAFFSGCETGLYRVNRTRMVLDALTGGWIDRGLLGLINHPSMFVATTLVGNNLANYVVSLAVVLGTQVVYTEDSYWPELVAPLVFAPLVFIYGELLPKHLFNQAPNRMLRRSGPALLFFTGFFLPLSGILWILSRGLEWLIGKSPPQLRVALARRELKQVFQEGHEAGILRPSQRDLVEGLFTMANRPIRNFVTPVSRFSRVQIHMTKAEVLHLAQRQRMTAVAVEDPNRRQPLIGYLRVVDLYLDQSDDLPSPRPLVEIPESDTYIAALMRLQRSSETLGRIVTPQGGTVGFVTARQLSRPLFRRH